MTALAGAMHAYAVLVDDTDTAPAPLCFVAHARRTGATAAELNLTFDQAVDIEDYPMTVDNAELTCSECQEWTHG